MSDDGNNICFSGGAIGADTAFGEIADKCGHRVVHYVFNGQHGTGPFRYVLTETQLVQADEHLRKANETLERGNFNSYYIYTKNILRRNYYQIKDTECVYAVAYLDEARMVEGGTAWAVQMACDLKVPNIYVFNQYTRRWNRRVDKYWVQMDIVPPRPHGLYTGIGSSKRFTSDGRKAIIQLYRTREDELVRRTVRSRSSA